MSSDDFNFDFGLEDDDEDRHIAMVVTRRAVNSLELELRERLYIDRQAALGDVDENPFQESDDDTERERTDAHLELVQRLVAPVNAMWSQQIEIARALGRNGDEKQYLAACKAEGVEPWPKMENAS